MVGGGREAGGLDEPVELGPGDGVGKECPDRPPRLDECGNGGHQRKRSSDGGRTSSAAEPSRNHAASSPRTTTAGTFAAFPFTSSAAPATSSARAISVTCSSRLWASTW